MYGSSNNIRPSTRSTKRDWCIAFWSIITWNNFLHVFTSLVNEDDSSNKFKNLNALHNACHKFSTQPNVKCGHNHIFMTYWPFLCQILSPYHEVTITLTFSLQNVICSTNDEYAKIWRRPSRLSNVISGDGILIVSHFWYWQCHFKHFKIFHWSFD